MFNKINNLLKNSNHIIIASHVNPDGDAIGSMLSLYIALKKIKKKVTLFNATKELPKKFDFLPFYKKIKNKIPENFDLLISVDCADLKRTGLEKKEFKIINIDHHKTNTNFGEINIIEENYASSSMVVFEIIEKLDIPISPECATCIYTALVEDSGFFSYERTSKKSFEIASKLVSYGAKPYKISNYLKNRNSLAKLRLMEIYLGKLKLEKYGKIAIVKFDLIDFKKTGANIYDADSFVQIGLSLTTVEISIFLYELKNQDYKFSLRSKNDIDCSIIAKHFNGGGHKKAAGFTAKKDQINNIINFIKNKTKV